ncbi:MAG: carbohydrate ABC transporter permease [Blautia sp.]|nr:carbohydrate ABC transporter permease [Blautia sp.]
MRKKLKTSDIMINAFMIIICLACLIPFLLVIVSSLTDEQVLLSNGYSFWPEKWSAFAYKYILIGSSGMQIIHGYLISIVVTVCGTLLSLAVTTLFAYPLSRKDLPLRKLFAFILFFSMLFNGGLVPTYMMWTQVLKIKNTIWALLLPNLLMNAFYVIMMRTYFATSIPFELIEAAKIDGASELRILLKIILPLSKPMMATLGFMTALGYWNDWLNGLYYVSDNNLFSIQNILNRMLLNIQYLTSSDASALASTVQLPATGIRMAVAVVGLLPILIIYPFFQKYLVKGIMIGGVKG